MPYWSGDDEGDVYVALPRAGFDEPVDGLGYSEISTFSPGDPGGPCQEEDDVCEDDVALPWTGSDEPIHLGQMARVAPVMRKVSFRRVMLDNILRVNPGRRRGWSHGVMFDERVFAFDLCPPGMMCKLDCPWVSP